ncbi:MAG: tRNA (adenosine(37)-N6)-threonylcarbamoyltransferase complex dimerization subunit type 1 TsaB [Akkermansiaceae bacterium]|nr:tRNA (adenosine(37)-N6)-threonylcarbamoyltransferase complex dimerization subunit type 1 TsaB [Armatimonadota bacterium]
MERDVLILAIDTSSETCSIAVSDNTVCRAEYNFRHERRLIERLPGIVQSLLADTGSTLADIEAFAVGLGPGSFTGVRVGVTMAKVWAMTLDKPVVGVSSLDALAFPHYCANTCRIAIAPTRRTESVIGFYGHRMPTSGELPTIIPHEQLWQTAQNVWGTMEEMPLLIGETSTAVWGTLPESEQERITPVADHPRASVVARLAFARLGRGESDDTDSLVPLYVTPPPTG